MWILISNNYQATDKYQVILRILREMAIASRGAPGLDYWAFKRKLEKEGLTDRQNGPLKLRLDLLESFMEVPPKPGSEPVKDRVPDFDETTKAGRRAKDEWFNSRKRKGQLLKKLATSWSFEPGTLTIVDLSCPFVDENAACALFIICLELFLENRGNTGRVVALDEAHKVCFHHQELLHTYIAPILMTTVPHRRSQCGDIHGVSATGHSSATPSRNSRDHRHPGAHDLSQASRSVDHNYCSPFHLSRLAKIVTIPSRRHFEPRIRIFGRRKYRRGPTGGRK